MLGGGTGGAGGSPRRTSAAAEGATVVTGERIGWSAEPGTTVNNIAAQIGALAQRCAGAPWL